MQTTEHPGRGYERLFRLMELLSSETRGYSLNEITQILEVPKSTVHLMIRHMLTNQYIIFNEDLKQYSIGPALVQMAFRIVDKVKIQTVAQPYLVQLSQQTTEDIYLAIRNGVQVIYIAKVEGSQSLRLNIGLGFPRLMHCSAAGKALLAWDQAGLLKEVVTTCGLQRMTPNTITEPSLLENELTKIRQQGYSVSNEEHIEGISGIAAPIFDFSGSVIAAITISSLKSRVLERQETFTQALLEQSKQLSKAFGYDLITNRMNREV